MTTFEKVVLSVMSLGVVVSSLILAVSFSTSLTIKGLINDISMSDPEVVIAASEAGGAK